MSPHTDPQRRTLLRTFGDPGGFSKQSVQPAEIGQV